MDTGEFILGGPRASGIGMCLGGWQSPQPLCAVWDRGPSPTSICVSVQSTASDLSFDFCTIASRGTAVLCLLCSHPAGLPSLPQARLHLPWRCSRDAGGSRVRISAQGCWAPCEVVIAITEKDTKVLRGTQQARAEAGLDPALLTLQDGCRARWEWGPITVEGALDTC